MKNAAAIAARKYAANARRQAGIDPAQLRAAAEALTDRPIGLLIEQHGEDAIQDRINAITSAALIITTPELGAHGATVAEAMKDAKPYVSPGRPRRRA